MAKIGRNDPCPCGSGQKYKRCCLSRDEAEHAAQHLLEHYPDVHDGLERLAMVAAARGDRPRAAEYYRKAADFVHAHADQYGPRMEVYLRRRATEFSAPREEVSGDQAL